MARQGTPRLRHLRRRNLARVDHQPGITDFLAERATALGGTGALTAFTAANATNQLTDNAHGLVTGDGPFEVSNSGGALPAGLSATASYWAIVVDPNIFQLAVSRDAAIAGTVVGFTTDGTGIHSYAPAADTSEDIWDILRQGVDAETVAAATDVDTL